MRPTDIPLAEWQTFVQSFNREHEGGRVSLFGERRGGSIEVLARDVVFRGLAVDTAAAHRSVVVTVDTNGERHLSHTITHPVAIVCDGASVHVKSELGTGFTIEFGSQEGKMTSLKEWGFDIGKFEAKAKTSIENARGDLSEITGVLRESLAKMKQALVDLQTTREPVADELRNGFERAWEEIEQAFARARRRVRESREAGAARKAGDDWLG
ncbi:MAG TPA: hypothetical protein VL284_04540 [Thermoanaerobaculia bacterium]|nr:hypothetical protein [Thermoanaerobaculia bacterium]